MKSFLFIVFSTCVRNKALKCLKLKRYFITNISISLKIKILSKTKQFLLDNNLELIESELTLIYGFFVMISLKASYLPDPISRFICRYQYFYDTFKQKDPTFSKHFMALIETLEKKLGLKYTHYANELFFNLYNNTLIRTPRHLKIACTPIWDANTNTHLFVS